MKWLSVVVIFLITITECNSRVVVCPNKSLNQGWVVVRSWSFGDPYSCCGERVKSWSLISELTDTEKDQFTSLETGCLMSSFLARRRITQLIYPKYCNATYDCGDKSIDDHPIECCPQGVCSSLSADGSSRCSQTEPVSQHGFISNLLDFSRNCKKSSLQTCLTCGSSCSYQLI